MLRPATDADTEAMLRWRNQEPNRQVSLATHVITPDEHAAWWARASTDDARRILVYERSGTPAGVVNFFDLDLTGPPRVGSWGFFLDAEGLDARGESLPAWIEVMREATGYAFDTLGLDELRGEVLQHNSVVRRMNQRFRFTEGPGRLIESAGRTVLAIPISLHRDHRRRPAGQPADQSTG